MCTPTSVRFNLSPSSTIKHLKKLNARNFDCRSAYEDTIEANRFVIGASTRRWWFFEENHLQHLHFQLNRTIEFDGAKIHGWSISNSCIYLVVQILIYRRSHCPVFLRKIGNAVTINDHYHQLFMDWIGWNGCGWHLVLIRRCKIVRFDTVILFWGEFLKEDSTSYWRNSAAKNVVKTERLSVKFRRAFVEYFHA